MTFAFKSSPARRARFLTLSALGLLIMLGSEAAAITVASKSASKNATFKASASARAGTFLYLPKLGAAPLRFAPPPAEATERPLPPSATAPLPSTEHPSSVGSTDPVTTAAPDSIKSGKTSEPPTKLLSILPDDTPHVVGAEDVMSYFQLPRQNEGPKDSGVNLPFTPAQPAGSALPPSSATYQQK